jgi:hypothetical protein
MALKLGEGEELGNRTKVIPIVIGMGELKKFNPDSYRGREIRNPCENRGKD